MTQLNIQLLLTGNELMTGDIVDSNSAMIAQQLLPLGLTISRKITVADDLNMLANEIKSISEQADILIINGGLGPTVDDLTAQALALAMNSHLQQHPQALEHLTQWGQQRGITLDQANLKQAMLPAGASIIDNSIGSAVGFACHYQGCDIYCTPGVPKELAIMLEQQIIAKIKQQVPHSVHYQVKRYQVFGIGEAKLQQMITQAFPQWPAEVLLGFRAASPMLELKLSIKEQQAQPLLQHWQEKLFELLGDHILTTIDNDMPTMAQHVIKLLTAQGKTLTTAESCTGGMIASLLTNIAGSSKAFEAGFVTYSNEMKTKMVNVSPKTLTAHGAVSEQVVLEMAQGALSQADADYAIAVSGIAGPDGGTAEKPVGSVWLAWGNQHQLNSHYFCIKGKREYFQLMVANRALDLIRRQLINSPQTPFYFD
ncbi:nicotinamide-nucleotide amidohydrolase PncC [Thalassotalea insulae]|uniref:CinA-like protein n=1 Tax=Thalassotalea insulae TaxID=2056778 RepID=A0ABQ6GQV2_9GAMM|nr:CinA family nicotinamide mononucleotide deamidase-related protein [Thalassotalea insulae]GLX77056.1 nicotinamide-nucleotide amidohydrolase PncC [Thalassotalea insulae]